MNAPATTGKLVSVGVHKLGAVDRFEYLRCEDCGTDYPRRPLRSTTCNGVTISACPWCRPDSAPWQHGRGA